MTSQIENERREYNQAGLQRADLATDPFLQFDGWMKQALDAELADATAMSIATVSADGQPSLRTVLLKFYNQDGFIFYTNQESKKAHEIKQNPKVALLFFWREFERQIQITGKATPVTHTESLKYFLTRPRNSQLGAWVSAQSSVISSRSILEQKFDEMKRKFNNKEVPLPSFWGGYRIVPDTIEFWQGRTNRLHDRFAYRRQPDNDWLIERLAP